MYIILGQDAFNDLDVVLRADLSANIPDADAQLICEYFETVLLRAEKRACLEDGEFGPMS